MDIRAINYFVAVFEERSFTAAAEKVHVVQSALSAQIRNLEDQFGAPLFERGARGVEPTPAGRRLYELCLPLLRDLAAAQQEVHDLVNGKKITGSLRIGLPSSICKGILGRVLSEFRVSCPKVDVSIVEAYHRTLTDQVQAGQLDVALAAIPQEHSGLAFHSSIRDLCVMVSGRPINGEPFTPCDLRTRDDLKLVVPSDRHLLGLTISRLIAGGDVKPRSLMRVDGTIATMESVLGSDWAFLGPMTAVINELDSKDIFIYPVVQPDLSFDLYLVRDQRRPLTPAARAFADILERELVEARARWDRMMERHGQPIAEGVRQLV